MDKAYQEVQDYQPLTYLIYCYAHKVFCCAES